MKKNPLFIFLIIFVNALLFAGDVNPGKALLIAQDWAETITLNFNENVTIESDSMQEIFKDGNRIAYVFSFNPRGFVVLSACDELPAVKFYTTSFNYNEHENSRKFTKSLFRDLGNLSVAARKKSLKFDPRNRKSWQVLKHQLSVQGSSESVEEISPLITSRWGQTGAENLKCPRVPGYDYRCPAGCVAIAYAQVMNYFEWPNRGRGSHSYVSHPYLLELSADFDHPYDWDNIKNSYLHEMDGTEEQLEAVSTLIYDVAVAFEMGFLPSYSSTDDWKAELVMPLYFKYSNAIKKLFKVSYLDQEWAEIIKVALQDGRPLIFGIDNFQYKHKVVLDGYRRVGSQEHFHINFGWSGKEDGYYALDNISEFTDIIGQDLVVDFVPPHYRNIRAPQVVSAQAFKNQSLLQSEYYIQIKWDVSPSEGIESYEVYRRDNYSPEDIDLVKVVPANEDNWTFVSSGFDSNKYEYSIVAVSSDNNKSRQQEWFKIVEEME